MNLNKHSAQRGLSLMELLIASGLGLLVIIVLGQVDVTRLVTAQRIHANAASYQEGLFAMQFMLKQLEGADRVKVDFDVLEFRIPTLVPGSSPPQFTFAWHEFEHDFRNQTLLFYPNHDCSTPQRVATNLKQMLFLYEDVSPAPPGGEPNPFFPGDDSNVLRVDVSVADPITGETRQLTKDVTIRAAAYTKILTGLDDDPLWDPPATPCRSWP